MQVREGAVVLELPDRDLEGAGPGTRESAFYNPSMALSRDVGVLVHRALAEGVPSVLDGLAGAGARGLRIAAETDVERVVLNDHDPDAVQTAKRNVDRNGVADRVGVRDRDLRDLLPEVDVAAVDVDPYGSPAPWFGPLAETVRPGDVVGLAATDTSTLHGRHPARLKQRYGAEMVRQEAEKEIGHRILLGALARRLAAGDLGMEPLVGFEHGHHFRHWVRVTGAPAEAMGTARRCAECGQARLDEGRACPCDAPADDSGPLWTGSLWDRDLLDALEVDPATLAEPAKAAKLVGRLRQEASMPALFVDLHALCSRVGCSVPSFEQLERRLHERGYRFCRTHYVETGFRTDAPRAVVVGIVEG